MTPIKEDYLKIIFELGGVHKKVSNKGIALSLGIAAGSVTEMITKLTEEKLVSHEPYASISLTKKGLRYATELVRKHRLWESFLVQKLHYDLPDVHPEAEVLEHETSDRLANSLDEFLQYPKYCPHGGVIPDSEGNFNDISHVSLADVEDGHVVTIERFIDNHELLIYLASTDLHINDEVKLEKHDPFEGPIQIIRLSDRAKMNISYKAAHNIFVHP
ncbi:Cro/Cl family transcriptional regulator [Paucilactobacillus hokkaidonensis JCM 18461]|uniref:Manganese transport regulator n=1 Tax=Paucilactobacillus hokkaidonensis JCM 18461 TaxID=1291742 RepID=A0A0A1GSW9_9LACO|nr:metal-dependent transcriptional regulator [Paucilactobacillus hokkaidonensis]BAP85065.1 Cro/Cl family transcriptional regulator [Paucilactobacillus hokkaidonensis JCM 18461]